MFHWNEMLTWWLPGYIAFLTLSLITIKQQLLASAVIFKKAWTQIETDILSVLIWICLTL